MLIRKDSYGSTFLVKENKERDVDMLTLFGYVTNIKQPLPLYKSAEIEHDGETFNMTIRFDSPDSEYVHYIYIDDDWLTDFNTWGIARL